MSEPIARYYDASKNPEGATFPGVPLRDITESEWEAIPDWLKPSIDESKFYRKTKARGQSDDKRPAAPAEEK